VLLVGSAIISKTVSAPGVVKLKIRAKGKQKAILNDTGKVKVKPKITYTQEEALSDRRAVGVAAFDEQG
jgi:hypothetical protein